MLALALLLAAPPLVAARSVTRHELAQELSVLADDVLAPGVEALVPSLERRRAKEFNSLYNKGNAIIFLSRLTINPAMPIAKSIDAVMAAFTGITPDSRRNYIGYVLEQVSFHKDSKPSSGVLADRLCALITTYITTPEHVKTEVEVVFSKVMEATVAVVRSKYDVGDDIDFSSSTGSKGKQVALALIIYESVLKEFKPTGVAGGEPQSKDVLSAAVEIVDQNRLLQEWVSEQTKSKPRKVQAFKTSSAEYQAAEKLFVAAAAGGGVIDQAITEMKGTIPTILCPLAAEEGTEFVTVQTDKDGQHLRVQELVALASQEPEEGKPPGLLIANLFTTTATQKLAAAFASAGLVAEPAPITVTALDPPVTATEPVAVEPAPAPAMDGAAMAALLTPAEMTRRCNLISYQPDGGGALVMFNPDAEAVADGAL